MTSITYRWTTAEGNHAFSMIYVQGTDGRPYRFGDGAETRHVEMRAFWISSVSVTQAFWMHVVEGEDNPAIGRGARRPMENISWDAIVQPGGFIDQLNSSPVRAMIGTQAALPSAARFRLPTETEWEYAARGGPHWRDGFRYSGSNDIDLVAWYDRKAGDHTQDVARKAPNQLGLFDLSGNVWEWCQDTFTPDVVRIPENGRAWVGEGSERVLRGGCYHNWAMHCTVSKRYAMERDYHDGCIGFRVVLQEEVSISARSAQLSAISQTGATAG